MGGAIGGDMAEFAPDKKPERKDVTINVPTIKVSGSTPKEDK
jgi:hypothetical protein